MDHPLFHTGYLKQRYVFGKKKKKRETLLNSEKKNSGNVFNLLMSGSSLQIWGRWVAMVLPQSKYCLFPLTRMCKKQKLG